VAGVVTCTCPVRDVAGLVGPTGSVMVGRLPAGRRRAGFVCTQGWTKRIWVGGPGGLRLNGCLLGPTGCESCLTARSAIWPGGAGGVDWSGCPRARRKSCDGARPTLENSTACQKSMPINLVGVVDAAHAFVGVGCVCWTANFLWLNFMIKSSGLGSVSVSFSYPSGFVFPACWPLVWGVCGWG
jgi:hypothetical protein